MNFLSIEQRLYSTNMSTEISRKKKLRRAHRASATRLQRTVSEVLVSFDPNKSEEFMPRLNQLKTSMQEKLKILNTLDEEILNIIDEANIDDKRAQSDVCREDLQLALEIIERVLRTISLPSPSTASTVTPSAMSQMPTTPSSLMLAQVNLEHQMGMNRLILVILLHQP